MHWEAIIYYVIMQLCINCFSCPRPHPPPPTSVRPVESQIRTLPTQISSYRIGRSHRCRLPDRPLGVRQLCHNLSTHTAQEDQDSQ